MVTQLIVAIPVYIPVNIESFAKILVRIVLTQYPHHITNQRKIAEIAS